MLGKHWCGAQMVWATVTWNGRVYDGVRCTGCGDEQVHGSLLD